ncbi:MAG: hypothetical protein JRF28_07400 [Deltaproteobacteria bacterium]|nr:hypothetical protein [Deltaproteobacteria bacterium]MBW2318386.1 hypothetical protein [Deltaproteobacteria bacterium]OEU44376.1 MAG: hypothetical protein BBJ60_09040 [Desulfobacterales bacterium S7086C20]
MRKKSIRHFRDLEVYRRAFDAAMQIFEMGENVEPASVTGALATMTTSAPASETARAAQIPAAPAPTTSTSVVIISMSKSCYAFS